MRIRDGLRPRRVAPIILGTRDDAGLYQRLRALVQHLGEAYRGLRTFELRRRAVVGGLVRARVDHEQQIARLDLVAFFERDAINVAADPRAHLDGFGCRDSPGEFVPLAHGFDHDLSRADLSRRRRRVRAMRAIGRENGGHHEHGKKRKSRAQQGAITRGVGHERLLCGQLLCTRRAQVSSQCLANWRCIKVAPIQDHAPAPLRTLQGARPALRAARPLRPSR
jgi:hypothetical protein